MGGTITAKKASFYNRVQDLFKDSNKAIFVVGIDNVSSQQMNQVRKDLRAQKTEIVCGKNSLLRKALRDLINEAEGQYDDLAKLLPILVENVSLVFIDGGAEDTQILKDVRATILANKVAAPAKAGAISPSEVTISAGPTGQDPSKTSFFQALGVPTKINRGTIEIASDHVVLTPGQKVGSSEASLLNMLNVSPFSYGMVLHHVYQGGQMFSAVILDLTEEELVGHFVSAVAVVSKVSLAISYPTLPMVSHAIINHYKNVLAVSIATDYTFEGSETIKDRIANPDAYAAAAPAAAAGGDAPAAAAAQEEEEESDEDMGMGLFD